MDDLLLNFGMVGVALLDGRCGSFGGLPLEVALETSEGARRALGVDAALDGARDGRFFGVDCAPLSLFAEGLEACCFFILKQTIAFYRRLVPRARFLRRDS